MKTNNEVVEHKYDPYYQLRQFETSTLSKKEFEELLKNGFAEPIVTEGETQYRGIHGEFYREIK